MFKFGFNADSEPTKEEMKITTITGLTWIESEEIQPVSVTEGIIQEIVENCETATIICDQIVMKHFCSIDVLLTLYQRDIELLSAEQNESDLQTAIYEGGLKIWEGTYDLMTYLKDTQIDFSQSNVLDLGCGVGLVGILALLQNAKSCYFQDYNSDVIKYITIPNVKINLDDYCKSKFYSGDWLSFSNLLEKDGVKFDYIFTSETIYNVDNYPKLLQTFAKLLNQTGTIFLAAKSHYFGVGGGISLFEDYLKKDGKFTSESVWKYDEGFKREILKIKFKN